MDAAIVILVIVLGVGGFAWRRRRYRQAEELRISSQNKPYENAAHDAFMLGNTCLMEGKFDDARAAFHHVIDLEPKHHMLVIGSMKSNGSRPMSPVR